LTQIEDLLKQCTVKITVPDQLSRGTGFFVAPGLILTCAHVVEQAADSQVTIHYSAQESALSAIVKKTAYDGKTLDLALVELSEPLLDHPCVLLDEEPVTIGQKLYSYGYSESYKDNGAPVCPVNEGLTGDKPPLLKLQKAQIEKGISGAALLNLKTYKVCGVIKETRSVRSDLGGLAIPTSVILAQFPELQNLLKEFHRRDHRWTDVIATISDPVLEHSAPPSAIEENPYKGLMAFEETDGKRFFGREQQIAELWEDLRRLHETEGTIRILPIYGSSGSGKSSLAQAGLIPKLKQCPIPGYGPARVALLVPGTEPLQALAIALARIATQDQTPVAKIDEFAEELKQKNKSGEYKGLQRIANALPGIDTSPLIVLVDQFEEVYSQEERGNDSESNQKQKVFLAEREAFIANLLCAAKDRSKRVTVVITFRIDFLEKTQKHLELNRLFSSQGFLVPAMNEVELSEAISKPAEQAGRALDEATVSLLMEQTRGQEGALPLLQFALGQIWEGLKKNTPPAETLQQIGGVGGALANRAQAQYDSLNELEKAIARRIFLGLVQLGEGTRYTRRRAAIKDLTSDKDDPDQVKAVADKFAQRSVRMIMIFQEEETAAVDYVEVTHEALFDHWQQLREWLEDNHDDIRFQRRLEEAARHWDQQQRPEGDLWRPPNLDLLKQYQQRAGDNMTTLQIEFSKASQVAEAIRQQKELKQKQFQKRAVVGLGALLILTIGFAGNTLRQLRQEQRQRVELLASTSEALLLTQPVTAEINSIAAVGLSQSSLVKSPNHLLPNTALNSLLNAIEVNRERIQLPHEAIVYSVAFSPNSKTIVSGDSDGTLRLWDVGTGQLVGQLLRAHKSLVSSVAFSPDGKTILSGSLDNTLRLWDAATDQPISQPLRGHEGGVESVAFSPDGKTILSGSDDKTLRLWNAATGQPIRQPLRGHEDTVYSVAFSPDSKTILSGSDDKTLRLWNAATGQPIGQPLRGHEGRVRSVAFSPDGKTILSGGDWDSTIRLWDAATGQPIGQPLRGHEGGVRSVAFSPDGKTILSGGADNTLRLWDAATGQPIGQPLRGHDAGVESVAFSPDGTTILSGSWDNTLRLWDAATDQPISQPLRGHEGGVESVAFSPDGTTILSGSNDKTLRLWDAATDQPIRQPLRGHEGEVQSVAFSPDGKTILSSSWDNTLRLWDAATGQLIGQPLRGHEGQVLSAVFSPDGKTILSGGADSTLRLWDAATGQPIGQPLRGHEDTVYSVAFSPDGKTILSGSKDSTLRLWDAATGQLIGQPLRDHDATVFSVAFSPDGKTILSGNTDNDLRLWDAATGQPIGQPLRGHEDTVYSVAFSPDGKTILSGSKDSTLRLWDAATGQPIGQPLRGHEDTVQSVAFSPDGRTVLSGSKDNTLRLWNISWRSLIQVACDQLQHHRSLIEPRTDVTKAAKQTCEQYAWNR
jgi:WD40 repeat protein